ncbi:hypothetical protein AB1Y20_023229 [Prymnesium parvum]|uniref:Fibrous sheath-interacting protein 1 n=1 Tax=Prymnesium parvum TaxID=97485 RepID=A0AB34JDA4_PRYPA
MHAHVSSAEWAHTMDLNPAHNGSQNLNGVAPVWSLPFKRVVEKSDDMSSRQSEDMSRDNGWAHSLRASAGKALQAFPLKLPPDKRVTALEGKVRDLMAARDEAAVQSGAAQATASIVVMQRDAELAAVSIARSERKIALAERDAARQEVERLRALLALAEARISAPSSSATTQEHANEPTASGAMSTGQGSPAASGHEKGYSQDKLATVIVQRSERSELSAASDPTSAGAEEVSVPSGAVWEADAPGESHAADEADEAGGADAAGEVGEADEAGGADAPGESHAADEADEAGGADAAGEVGEAGGADAAGEVGEADEAGGADAAGEVGEADAAGGADAAGEAREADVAGEAHPAGEADAADVAGKADLSGRAAGETDAAEGAAAAGGAEPAAEAGVAAMADAVAPLEHRMETSSPTPAASASDGSDRSVHASMPRVASWAGSEEAATATASASREGVPSEPMEEAATLHSAPSLKRHAHTETGVSGDTLSSDAEAPTPPAEEKAAHAPGVPAATVRSRVLRARRAGAQVRAQVAPTGAPPQPAAADRWLTDAADQTAIAAMAELKSIQAQYRRLGNGHVEKKVERARGGGGSGGVVGQPAEQQVEVAKACATSANASKGEHPTPPAFRAWNESRRSSNEPPELDKSRGSSIFSKQMRMRVAEEAMEEADRKWSAAIKMIERESAVLRRLFAMELRATELETQRAHDQVKELRVALHAVPMLSEIPMLSENPEAIVLDEGTTALEHGDGEMLDNENQLNGKRHLETLHAWTRAAVMDADIMAGVNGDATRVVDMGTSAVPLSAIENKILLLQGWGDGWDLSPDRDLAESEVSAIEEQPEIEDSSQAAFETGMQIDDGPSVDKTPAARALSRRDSMRSKPRILKLFQNIARWPAQSRRNSKQMGEAGMSPYCV